MSVRASTEYMDSMMNVSAATLLKCKNNLNQTDGVFCSFLSDDHEMVGVSFVCSFLGDPYSCAGTGLGSPIA